MKTPGRRQFLLGAGVAGLGALGFFARGGAGARAAAAVAVPVEGLAFELPETLQVLGVDEYLTLAAACERVFPRDDTPGANDLGVPAYVDRALTARPVPRWTEGFRTGLTRLDARAMSTFGAPFSKLPTAKQDALLAAWEASVEQDEATFVHALVTATMEGAFCDPVYGGNRGRAGWTELGFHIDPYTPTRTS
jgi:hypothetical protein